MFREEAIAAQREPQLGSVTINSTNMILLLVFGVAAIIASILIIMFFGTYTNRTTLTGFVLPENGILKVMTSTNGIVSEVLVKEYETVSKGQPLVKIRYDRYQNDRPEINQTIIEKIESRKNSILSNINQQRLLHTRSRLASIEKVEQLENEIFMLQNEINLQKQLMSYAKKNESRLYELAAEGFVSPAAVQEKSEAAMIQISRFQALKRSLSVLSRELGAVKLELSLSPMREASQISELELALKTIEQELIEAQSRKEWVLVAPQSGKISNINTQAGQTAGLEKVLMTIIPINAKLEAQIFATSKEIGFIKINQSVSIRYQSFPYQKFGHQKGKIIEVSKNPLFQNDLLYPLSNNSKHESIIQSSSSELNRSTEPIYRIRIKLEKQDILAHGEKYAIQPGMQLESDVMLESRSIVEWILEPLLSIRGKISAE